MKKNIGETPQDFRSRVARKVDICYGDFAAAKKKILILDNFVYGLPIDMRNGVLMHRPTKIDEAVTAAMMFDNLRTFSSNSNMKTKTRPPMENSRSVPSKPTIEPRENGWTGITCFKCNAKGHKASECPVKRKPFVSVVTAVAPRLFLDVTIFPSGSDRWLVDSGASMSILPESRYEVDGPCSRSLVGVGGLPLKCAGTKKMGLYIGKKALEHTFNVAKTSEGILGMDILEKIRAKVDFAEQILILPDGEKITLLREGQSANPPEESTFVNHCGTGKNAEPIHSITNENDDLEFFIPIALANQSPCIMSRQDAWEELGSKNDIEIKYVPDTRELVEKILRENHRVFEGSGRTNVGIHKIETTPGPPIFQRPYKIPEVYLERADDKIARLFKEGYVQNSTSGWCSPLVVVEKKSTKQVRVCVDMRKVNERTIPDRFPTPNADDILNEVHGKVFSVLDCDQAFYQVELRPEDREKTAFSFRGKLYEFTVMCFGQKNAPATWCRIIRKVVDGLPFVRAFFDDVIVFSQSIEDHKVHLNQVLARFIECNLRLNREKCKFFCKEVDYLGHVVSGDGISVSPKKIDAIEKFPRPDSFLSLNELSLKQLRASWILSEICSWICRNGETSSGNAKKVSQALSMDQRDGNRFHRDEKTFAFSSSADSTRFREDIRSYV